MLPSELPDLTADYAGVIVLTDRETFLWALGDQNRWKRRNRVLQVPVSAIGGGVEPGEHPTESLQREAQEEIGVGLEIMHSAVPEMFWRQADGGEQRSLVPWQEEPAPAFVHRREDPDETYVVWLYAARLHGQPVLDDLPGLVEVPLKAVPALLAGVRVDELASHGISLSLKDGVKLTKATRLYLPARSSEEALLRPTLQQRGLL